MLIYKTEILKQFGSLNQFGILEKNQETSLCREILKGTGLNILEQLEFYLLQVRCQRFLISCWSELSSNLNIQILIIIWKIYEKIRTIQKPTITDLLKKIKIDVPECFIQKSLVKL